MLAQVILNGCVTGLILALPAMALTITYSIMKFPNFAVGAMMTVGAYLAFALNVLGGLPLLAAGILASLALAALLVATDGLVFAKLRDRTPITRLVGSIAIAFIFENAARFVFGNTSRSFTSEIYGGYRWAGLRLNLDQLYAASTVFVALVGVYTVFNHTALGRSMRAVADNPSLAAVRGINRDAVVKRAWVIVGLLIGAASVLAGMDRAIDPQLGASYLISVFAGAIVGGLGSAFGAVAGSVAIGLVEELSTLAISPNYREATGFASIALILILRPQGLFGRTQIKRRSPI